MIGSTATDAYVCTCKHGKVQVMMVDIPEEAKENGKEIARAMKQGLRVDRVTMEDARKSNFGPCPECRAERRKP